MEAVEQLRMDLPLAALTYVDVYLAKYSLITQAKQNAGLDLRVVICSCSSIKVLPLSGFLGLVLADVGAVLCLKMAVFRRCLFDLELLLFGGFLVCFLLLIRGCCVGLFWSRFGLKLLLFASGDCVGSFVDCDLVALARA
ncbi:hypothetical protein U1Q18_009350 [Sarracenia purpurea var. burkii]